MGSHQPHNVGLTSEDRVGYAGGCDPCGEEKPFCLVKYHGHQMSAALLGDSDVLVEEEGDSKPSQAAWDWRVSREAAGSCPAWHTPALGKRIPGRPALAWTNIMALILPSCGSPAGIPTLPQRQGVSELGNLTLKVSSEPPPRRSRDG